MYATTFAETLQNSVSALKGLLIIIVIMDHNDLIRTVAPTLFKPLTFHVLGFLILPFLVPVKPIDRYFFRDRLIRYLVPFWWVLTFASVMFALLFHSGDDLGTVITHWLAAITIGSASLVKTSSGFYYLWFLPCLAGLVMALSIFQSLKQPWQYAVTAVTVLGHVCITAFPEILLRYVPFGLLIVVWVFPLGLLMRWAVHRPAIFHGRYVILGTFLCSYGYLVFLSLNVEIMTLQLYSLAEPLLFLAQDLSAFCGVLVAMWIAIRIGSLRIINLCGKHSLMVYLLHPLVFFLGYKVLGAAKLNLEFYPLLVAALFSVALTALISVALASAIAHTSLTRTWLTPKDWNDWGPVRLAARWSGR